MFERVAFAGARLWTWEVVTGFDGVLDAVTLRRRFAEDFREMESGEPVFREMVSFNSSGGRRHRYLVLLPSENVKAFRGRFDRVLPQMASLYAYADRFMRSSEGFENCRMAFLSGGWLYALVFFEGRLCHWSEEPGHDLATAEERLSRLDEFLHRDDLFSRVKEWCCRLVDFDRIAERDVCQLRRIAMADPFWKKLDLDDYTGMKPRTKKKLALIAVLSGVIVAILCFCAGKAMPAGNFVEVPEPLPALSPAPEICPSDEIVEKPVLESRVPVDHTGGGSEVECILPTIHLQGVVEGRLFQASVDGGTRGWFRAGDSIGNYAVVSIGKDRAFLECGGKKTEVRNGP